MPRQYEGVVRNIDIEAGHGFIRCAELGTDFYFRLDRGEHIRFDPDQNKIVGYVDIPPDKPAVSKDRIIFEIQERNGKFRAQPWGFMAEYERACKAMARAL